MPHLAIEWKSVFGIALAFSAVALSLPAPVVAQESDQVTFSKDIAPILQRSCQQCHRPDGVAPMPLVTYEDVQPHAMAMMRRTGIRDRQGTMPPWYVEKDIGIQQYKDDPSLSDEEVAAIATWARNGTPEGDRADLPTPLVFEDALGWRLGSRTWLCRPKRSSWRLTLPTGGVISRAHRYLGSRKTGTWRPSRSER